MRDDVLLVLNEREPLKLQMASELLDRLRSRKLSVERLAPTEDIATIVQERSPKVIILDYLLGDFATALDVLNAVDVESVACILWTDEPSVGVAVQAMKLGARDFIELGTPRSLERILAAIDEALPPALEIRPLRERRRTTPPREIVSCQSPSSRASLGVLESAAAMGVSLVVLLGERGTGRNAWARHFHSSLTMPGILHELDWDQCAQPLENILGSPRGSTGLLSLGANVFLDHVEFDTGELLEAASTAIGRLANRASNETVLLVGTQLRSCAEAWAKLPNSCLVEIPPLRNRELDILPLLQDFKSIADTFSKSKDIEARVGLIDAILQENWPGNVKQLKAAILEAVSTPKLGAAEDLSSNEELWNQIISAKHRWERYQESSAKVPPPLIALQVLQQTYGNQRIAAAELGIGLPQLRAALSATTKDQQ